MTLFALRVLTAAVVALGMCACSSGVESDSSASNADAPFGPAEAAAELPGELDQRVIEAVAPVSGESMPSSRWLKEEIHSALVPSLSACLEARGRLDLLGLAERQQEFFGGSGQDPFLYPEPDLLVAQGLGGQTAELPDDVLTGMLSGDESTDGGVVAACSQEATGTSTEVYRLEELQRSIAIEWAAVVAEASYDDTMTPYYSDFADCLRSDGTPDEAATGNPADYILWAESQRMNARDGNSDQLAIEQAQIYVECGADMFDARAELLRAERDAFVEAHRDQFQEIGDLLGELGVS